MDTYKIVNMFSFSDRSLQGQAFFPVVPGNSKPFTLQTSITLMSYISDASVFLAAISQGCALDLRHVHSEVAQVNAGIYKMVFISSSDQYKNIELFFHIKFLKHIEQFFFHSKSLKCRAEFCTKASSSLVCFAANDSLLS